MKYLLSYCVAWPAWTALWLFKPIANFVCWSGYTVFPSRQDQWDSWASRGLDETSLFAVVQWVSCRTIINALFLPASCSITLILFADNASVFSCIMLSLVILGSRHAPRLETGVPSPRRTHPARIVLVGLVVAGSACISLIPLQGGPREGTCHPSRSWKRYKLCRSVICQSVLQRK